MRVEIANSATASARTGGNQEICAPKASEVICTPESPCSPSESR